MVGRQVKKGGEGGGGVSVSQQRGEEALMNSRAHMDVTLRKVEQGSCCGGLFLLLGEALPGRVGPALKDDM